MAIQITTDKTVRTFQPKAGKSFNIQELNDMVGGWIEPFKVGPVWVMYLEKAKEEGSILNELASFFFDIALYGDVLIVPPQQLPSDWDLMEDSDMHYTADMIDSGFLLSLHNAVLLKSMREEHAGLKIDPIEFFERTVNASPKEEYVYTPPEEEPVDENTEDFLKQSYEYISKSPLQFSKGVILEDNNVIIRANESDRKQILKLMESLFLETEEYEKCAVLKRISENC